jgi:hypothetical protein
MKNFELEIRNRRLEPLRPIFKSWFSVLQEYINRTGDLPCWYRERPQVGFFATAAWKFGWATLEEWGMKKGSQREQSHGRNDLWIGLPKERQEWFIEAKHTWCDINKGIKHSSKTLDKAIGSAKWSAIRLTCKSPSKKIAAVFASPVWKPNLKNTDCQKAKEEWIAVCKRTDSDAIAFFFVKESEVPKGRKDGMCVGSALLMKMVK